ncbi:hypothetical protein ABZW18_00010 [Streptomyces sp. NPDC004647]|uniref:ATP-grasp domain-containing protein n=1 Tax=Streptomyces sp. NPDC004647 TaxID=3154671 RepID=UPI0033B79B75
MSPPSHLLLLGTGPCAEWEHAMQRLAAASPLLLLDERPPTWQRPYLAAARTASLLEPTQVLQVVQELANSHTIDGIMTFQPAYQRAAALVRQELGLPGPDTKALQTCGARHRTAAVLERAGIEGSSSLRADSYQQALEAAHHVGFPLICKPDSPRRRYAARTVSALPDLAEAFSAVTTATWPGTGTVIEPLLDGLEATAYTYGTHSGTHVIALSHTTFDPAAEHALVPAELVVDADDVCVTAIEASVSRALAAVGLHTGPAQVRLRITATGPRIISISPHLTDPLAAQLIEQVTGVDLVTATAAHAVGHTARIEPAPLGAMAVRYLHGTTATAFSTTPDAAAPTPFIHVAHYDTEHRVGPLRRTGHVLVTGSDYPQCVARLSSAGTHLRTPRLTAVTEDFSLRIMN